MNKVKAKAVLALHAVRRLASSDMEPWTMRQLFAPIDNDAYDPVMVKYRQQKTWRREFIQRLIDHGVIEKVALTTNHVAYQALQKEILRGMVKESSDEFPGNTIKWFLFPGSYDPPEQFAPIKEEFEEEFKEPDEGENEVVLTTLRLLTEISEHLVEIRQSQKNLLERVGSLENNESRIKDIVLALPDVIGTSIHDIHDIHDSSFDKFEKGINVKLKGINVKLNAIEGAITALAAESRRLIISLNVAEKVSTFKAQLDVWSSTVQTQGKDFNAGLEMILDVVGRIEENVAESTR